MNEKFQVFKTIGKDADLWSIATALRGCDIPIPFLKGIFTARIRYLAGVSSKKAMIRDVNYVDKCEIDSIEEWITTYVIEQKNTELVNQLLHGITHYLSHVESALATLYLNKLISKDEYEFLLSLEKEILKAIWLKKKISRNVIKHYGQFVLV